MTTLIRRQATALKNFLLKDLSPVQEAFAAARDPLTSSGAPSISHEAERSHSRRNSSRSRGATIISRLFAFALLLGAASSANAGTFYCSTYGGVLDGFDPATFAYVSTTNNTLGIDQNCTIKNWPQDNGIGGFPITNINFYFPGGADYYIVFDNVHYEGNMSCNDPQNSNFWMYWAPGSFNKISDKCQQFMVPVDMVVKTNPAAQSTATIGVPLTYTITAPKLGAWDVNTYTFHEIASSDTAEIRDLVVVDDLTQSGAALTYVTNKAYLVNVATGTRTPLNGGNPLNLGASATWLTAHPDVTSDGTKHLVFSYENNPDLVSVPPGFRVDIDLTVVLDNDVTTNYSGRQFTNTADMWFDKRVSFTRQDGTTGYTDMTGLHGWPSTTLPMTIAAPNFVVNKSTTSTAVNLSNTITYTVDAQNTGGWEAWNVTLEDIIPQNTVPASAPPKGMCATDPTTFGTGLSARILDAGGATIRSLTGGGVHYTLAWSTTGPDACTIILTLTDSGGAIKPTERLEVTYQTRIDPTFTNESGDLINVAGATHWFNAGSTSGSRKEFLGGGTGDLTNGTPGVPDFQDNASVAVALSGYYFEKTVSNRATGDDPAISAAPGDTLRYRLHLFNVDQTISNISIADPLDATKFVLPLNPADIVTCSVVGPAAVTVTPVCSFNSVTNELRVSGSGGSPLGLPQGDDLVIEFDLTLQAGLGNGVVVSNQAQLTASGITSTIAPSYPSDDPNVNGVSDPDMLGDEDRTDITIVTPGPLTKATPAQTNVAVGQQFSYQITVPATAVPMPLYDVQVLDTLPANLRFVSASAVVGTSTLTLSDTDGGADNNLVLVEQATGLDIPANGQAIVTVTVAVKNDALNQSGSTFQNTATYAYRRINGAGIYTNGTGMTTGSMTVVEPAVTNATKGVAFVSPVGKLPTDPAAVGDVLEYAVTVPNSGNSTAFDASVVDTLPVNVALVAGSATATINGSPVAGFVPAPTTLPGGALAWGNQNGDETLDIPAGQSLVLTYRVTVVSVNGQPFTNSVYTDWTSLDGTSASERTGVDCLAGTTPALNDYCVGPTVSPQINTLDNTSISKAATLDTYVESPASTTDPVLRVGDTVTYELTLNLQEYTTRNVVVTDVLPAGMALQSFTIDPGPTTFNYTMVAQPTVPSAPGATLTWNFGDIYDVPSNNATPVDKLVIRYVAKVVTDAPSVGVDYTTSILRDNSATLSYTGGDPTVYPTRLTSTERIEVRQPAMSAVTKTGVVVPNPARTVAGNGSQSTPYQVLVASDTMNFQIRSCNNGLAPAYGVQITDVLGSQFDAASITGLTVSANGAPLASPSDYAYTLTGSTMSFTLATPVNPGQCVTVAYGIGFRSDVAPNALWSNQAQLPQYASLPSNGRLYSPTDVAQVWMTNSFPGMTPIKTVSTTEAAIGQEVNYEIIIPAGNAALSNVVIDDPLDARLEYLGFTSTDPTVTLAGGSNLRFNIAQIPAGVETRIQVKARVRNIIEAQAGPLANAVSYSYTGSTSATVPLTATVSFNIVEPAVDVQKSVPASEPKAGDTLTYTVTLTASGGAAGDIFSDAHDAIIKDTLSLGLAYVGGSAKLNGAPIANPAVSGDGIATKQVLTWDTGMDIAEGTAPVLTYQVTVLSGVGAGQLLRNDVRVEWTSLEGSSTFERNGTGTSTTDLNNYFNTASTELWTLKPDAPTKMPAQATATIGERFTYYVTVPSATATAPTALYDVNIYDNLALTGADLKFVSAALDTTGTGSGPWSPLSNSGTDTNLIIGTAGGIDIPAGGKAMVAITVEMLDTATNSRGDSFNNTADYTYNTVNGDASTVQSSIPSNPANMTVVEPLMSPLTKVDLGTGRIGSGTSADPYKVNVVSDVMNFRLSSCNNGNAPAYSVIVTDQFAAELDEGDLSTAPVVKIGGSILVSGTDFTYSYTSATREIRIALIKAVDPTQCVTVDYSIGFHATVAPNSKWANQAALPTYASLDTNGRTYTSSDMAQVWMTNAYAGVTPTKTVDVTEAVIGQEVNYEIVIPAGNAALSNVVIDDPLDARLEYLGFTSTGPTVTLAGGSNLRFNIAQIPAGQETRIQVKTRVRNIIEAQAGPLANAVSYSYTGSTSATVPLTATVSFNIVEPAVAISKVVSNPTPAIGERLTYTLTLAAAGGAAYSDARDIKITDTLGAGLAYVPGSTTGMLTADPVITLDASGNQVLTWDSPTDITEGTAPVVSYKVDVLASTGAGQTLRNDVRVEWTSLDGASAVERNGTGATVNDLNNYFDTAFAIATTPLRVDFTKSVVNATTGQDPGSSATPGDKLHYRLTLTNINVVALGNVRIEDALAAEFAAGTLSALTVSDPAAVANANPTGGANGTGLVTVQLATLAAGATLVVDFDVTLKSVVQSGTNVLNQASLTADGLPASTSDQTSTLISSAPRFLVQKTSADLTGDVNVLRVGDTLRYTISVRNIGNENATGVTLRDLVPAYTNYAAGTTRKNGVLVADVAGTSPLQTGLLLGDMSALAGSATNVATVTFDVVVNANVLDGTIISNQGFVNGSGAGTSGAVVEQPSDDPATTTVPDDPTRDIVGSLPLLDAQKVAALQTDVNSNGALDAGETLRYTITVNNFGTLAAADVVLTDAIPQNTSYVPGSATLNGQPVADVGGASPLVGGLQVGPIAAGASATVIFDVAVNSGVGAGTAISNQGYVASPGLATEPTDADGYDANGDQPTIVVVGSAQQLAIVKGVSVVGGGAAQPGGQLEYVVRVTNTGAAPATQVVLTDDLTPLAGKANYVAGSATLNGSAAGVSYAAPTLTANYAATYGNLPAGATATLRFRVQIDAAFLSGTLTNTAQVAWNTPALNASASASIDIGAIPGSAVFGGHVWHDVDFDNVPGAGEQNLAGWTVELFRNSVRLGGAITDAGGLYRFSGVAPTVGSDQYELRFTAAGATATTAKLGLADSAFTNGMQQISGITAASGSNLQNLNLPIDPNGAVLSSISRTPIAGARVTLLHNGTPVVSSCFSDPAQQNQVTLASGFYKFDLTYGDASCPLGGDYVISVTPPATGYVAGPSRLIPPVTHAATAAYDVATCAADAVPTTTGYCEAYGSAVAPGIAVPASQISHYLHLKLSNPEPIHNQAYNNNLFVDTPLSESVSITKSASVTNVSRGQFVPYTITVTNTTVGPLDNLQIVDNFPPGFKYVEGSARSNSLAMEPVRTSRTLTWSIPSLAAGAKLEIKLLFIVGSGVGEGEYVNRAQMFSSALGASNEASATVRVIPDPTFDCTDVIGKVFDDVNRNGYQDAGENGLPGVRVATARGLLVTTDEHGRFHITCAVVPDENRGSNFILKVDDRTLPTGYRITTENPRVQRATRGKMMKFNFGAAIHKVVRIDIANGVFEPGTTDMRMQWKPRMYLLMGELKKGPSMLRLAYMAEVEDEKLVEARLKALKQEIAERWSQQNGPYELVIETEVFWRTGAPPSRSALK